MFGIRRREFMALVGGAAAWPLAARAQQSEHRPLVGLISPQTQATAAHNVDEFRKGLRDLGYVESRNLALELRFADGYPERLPKLAADMVALKPDVIVIGSSAGILAAHKATQTIPLVMLSLFDPIALGLIKSIARPGGNITGIWLAGDELPGKRLAMLKDLAPRARRIGAFLNPEDANDAHEFRVLPTAADALGLDLRIVKVRHASELESAFTSAGRMDVEALYISRSPLFSSNQGEIVATVARLRLPAIYGWREFTEAGGLASYGPSLSDNYRRSAGVVDKILKGASPADLPVEIPTRFELIINLRAAKEIGLTVSESFVLLADEVIE
jgi:putative ABC transport system substrate-binding protein